MWSDISYYLNERMSGRALHTFVFKGRHGIKEKLGFIPLNSTIGLKNIGNEYQDSNESGM